MDAVCQISPKTAPTPTLQLQTTKRFYQEPAFWCLILMAGLLCFGQMDAPLQEPEEPRYAEIPRQMLVADQWMVPILHGQPYLDKPPLLYWLVMLSYKTFGVHDWSARLPTCLATFLTIFAVYFWARSTLGVRPALAGAGILALSGRFLYLGRLLTMNSLLCLCITAAWGAASFAMANPRKFRHWWLLSALACGLGVLSKGAASILLVLVPVLLITAFDSRLRRPSIAQVCLFVIITVGVPAPWLWWMNIQDPNFLYYFFWKHHFVRYLAPFDHAKPFWYFFGEIFVGMLPWAFLFWPLAKSFSSKDPAMVKQRSPIVKFALLAGLWSLLFFSLSGSKRAGYILPVMPPLALALGWYLDLSLRYVSVGDAHRRWVGGSNSLGWRMAGFVLLLSIGASSAAFASGLLSLAAWLSTTASALMMFVVGFLIRFPSAMMGWQALVVATFAMLFGALHFVYPGYARRFSMRDELQPFAALAADSNVKVVSYPRRWDSVTYYLRQEKTRVCSSEEADCVFADLKRGTQTLAIYKADDVFESMLNQIPLRLRFVLRNDFGQVSVGWFRPLQEGPEKD